MPIPNRPLNRKSGIEVGTHAQHPFGWPASLLKLKRNVIAHQPFRNRNERTTGSSDNKESSAVDGIHSEKHPPKQRVPKWVRTNKTTNCC